MKYKIFLYNTSLLRAFAALISTIFSLLIFSSCKNDLKLNAPYKEIPTVYAVLNPQDPIQMIRINKVFLGAGDANVMAKVADSINYQPGDLLVTLQRSVSGTPDLATPTGNKTIITFRDSVIQTNPGAFNTSQRVYYTTDKLFTWGDYLLTVTNTKTKNVFTAKASAFSKVTPSGYTPLCPPYYPVPVNPLNWGNAAVYINFSNPATIYSIRYSPNAAVIYQLTMRIHYYDSLYTGITVNNYVDFPFANQTVANQIYIGQQGPFLVNSFQGADIYNVVGNSLSQNSLSTSLILGRRVYKIQFIVYSSTQDYADYLQFTAPSLNIAQEKPIYSNFINNTALGIFTFRDSLSIVKEVDAAFVSEFATYSATCPYKFFTSAFSIPPCNP